MKFVGYIAVFIVLTIGARHLAYGAIRWNVELALFLGMLIPIAINLIDEGL